MTTNAWTKLSYNQPQIEEHGEKVLIYRISTSSQQSTCTSIYDTDKVKHCDPDETWWMPLPVSPLAPEMKTYGKCVNGWYWLLIDNTGDARNHIDYYEHNKSYVEETLEREDGIIAVNDVGGFHGNVLANFTNIVRATDFPD